MEKQLFVLQRRDGIGHAEFARACREGARRGFATAPGLRRATLLAAEASDVLLRGPGRAGRPSRCDAVVMAWRETGGADPGLDADAAARVGRRDGYRVEEVVHWGEAPAPGDGGWVMLYFGRRLPGQSRRDFVRRYRDGHAPLAREHHPGIAHYVQNFVEAPFDPGAPALDSVAELHFRCLEDYRQRFYRDETSPGLIARDVAGFLDPRATWALVARPVVTRGAAGAGGAAG